MSRFLFGVPVMTLSEVVAELNVAQGNVNRNHFASNMIHAKWVWKDLLWTNVWKLTQVYLEIVDGKVTLPQNVIRVVNVSVKDKCGNVQSLGYNPNINTLDIRCSTNECNCKCGGKDTYCKEVENIQVKTEIVVIEGVEYTKTIYTRRDLTGSIYEIANVPTYDVASGEVVFIEERKILCNLETTTNGCIKATEPNRRALTQYCGCYFNYGLPDYGFLNCNDEYWKGCGDWRHRRDCQQVVPTVYNDYGFYAWDAQAGNEIHIKHSKATHVIVAYQTNGDADAESLVPEYALSAMLAGIYHRQRQYSPVFSMGEKREAKYAYRAAKTELFEFQHPLRVDDFVKAQVIRPAW